MDQPRRSHASPKAESAPNPRSVQRRRRQRSFGRLGEILLADLLLATLISVGVLLAGNFMDDKRAERERELEAVRATAADKRQLQVGLALDRDLTGLTLPGWDMAGIRLPGRDLTGADLSDSDLSGADLSGATLVEANLNGATLRDADLNGAQLSHSSFRNADLSNATIYKGDATGADFGCANLRGSRTYASFAGAAMTNADLTGANFSESLQDADLRSSNLSGVDFAGSLEGTRLDGAYWDEDDPPIWPADFTPPSSAGPGDPPEDPEPKPDHACYAGP